MKSGPRTSPEFDRFNALVGKVISVPKVVIDQREKEYQERSKSNPPKRGPRPRKTTPKAN